MTNPGDDCNPPDRGGSLRKAPSINFTSARNATRRYLKKTEDEIGTRAGGSPHEGQRQNV